MILEIRWHLQCQKACQCSGNASPGWTQHYQHVFCCMQWKNTAKNELWACCKNDTQMHAGRYKSQAKEGNKLVVIGNLTKMSLQACLKLSKPTQWEATLQLWVLLKVVPLLCLETTNFIFISMFPTNKMSKKLLHAIMWWNPVLTFTKTSLEHAKTKQGTWQWCFKSQDLSFTAMEQQQPPPWHLWVCCLLFLLVQEDLSEHLLAAVWSQILALWSSCLLIAGVQAVWKWIFPTLSQDNCGKKFESGSLLHLKAKLRSTQPNFFLIRHHL